VTATLERVDTVTWKTWRQALGLTPANMAAYLGVSERTIEDWEQGRRRKSPPDDAVTWLTNVRDLVAARVDSILAANPGPTATLTRYRNPRDLETAGEELPFPVYNAMLGLALAELERRGIHTTVVWAEQPSSQVPRVVGQ
jgi:transcriptional regulator with XRE-family HTH domain